LEVRGVKVRLIVALLLASTAAAFAQPSLPAELQATIIAKVLAYDRSFKNRRSARVGVLVKAEDGSSAELVDAFRGLGPGAAQGTAFVATRRRYKDPADLTSWMTVEKIDVLYVGPGLDGDLESIRGAARQSKAVTVTPVRAFVERGLAIGVVSRGAKPGIVVNRAAAAAAGMDLDAKLLSLAEVLN
jgi:hypothetical protein